MLAADYVTTDEGTGIVHLAPAFGEEDKLAADAAGIVAVVPVDAAGRFTAEVFDYEGVHVFDANLLIIDDLKATTAGTPSGSVTASTVLLRRETYDHPYPHCWRCKNPLIYRAVSSWFVEVTKIRDRMGELNGEHHLGARPCEGRPVRQVAGQRPRLVDQPESLLGHADPDLEVRRPRVPADRRLRLDRRAGARLRGDRSPICTGRTSTS